MKNYVWLEDCNDITLVAIVPRLKDWEIIKEKKWYRIPVESAPSFIDKVKYLAFYFPKVFGDDAYKIIYYSKIKDYEIKKRLELLPDEAEHPHSDKRYYKINLGNLEKLPEPVVSKSFRRIVFIPTTLTILLSAREINDLYHTSPIEEKLYMLMKENGIHPERQVFVEEDGRIYALDFAIYCKKGKIDVECDGIKFHSGIKAVEQDRKRNNELTAGGWRVLRFSGSEIYKHPKKCISLLKKTITSLGGEVENIN